MNDEEPAGGSLARILLVDDEAHLLAALQEMMSAHGYEVAGFPSGAEALAALQAKDFDILLTDLMMPGMNGIEVFRKAAAIDPHLVGIIMTGHATVQTAVEAMKVGVYDYLLKPFKTRALLPLLDRAVAARRLRMENLQLRQTLAIYELGQTMSYSLALSTILDKVADGALQQCEADEASIMLPTPGGEELYIAAVRGRDRGSLLGQRVPMDRHVAGWVAGHREPIVLHGAVADPRYEPLKPRSDIELAVSLPLLVGGRLAGILNLNFTRPRRALALGELKALSIFGSIAGAALEGARMHEVVRAAERKYRGIFEGSTDGMFQATPDGMRFVAANPAMARMLGYGSPEELIGAVTDIDRQVFPGTDARGGPFQRLAAGGPIVEGECECVRRDGTRIWVLLSGAPARGGEEGVGFEGSVVDISARKCAEDALDRERALLATVIDNIPDVIYVKDTESHFLLTNSAMRRLVGVDSPQKLVGKTDSDFFPREMADQYLDDEKRILLTGEALVNKDEHARGADGREFRFFTTKVPLKDERGRLLGIVGINRDVTEQRNLERQLLQAQKMDAIGKLAGGIAHDFNNVLTAIIGYGDILQARLGSDDPLQQDVEEIRKAGLRAASLTQQLLAFGRRQILQMKVLDLNAIVTGMQGMIRRLVKESVSMDLFLDPALGMVRADPGQVEQVLMNLVINASDAMPQGGKITIETANVELEESYARMHPSAKPGPCIQLAVSDTGTGMDEETRVRIFEPFFTTKAEGKGTGLGLSMVYGIVKQSGGNIWVYSEPGRGTAFKIYLPRVYESTQEIAEEPPAAAPREGTETVLVLEDEDMIRQIISVVLTEHGYTALLARDGEEALALCEGAPGPIHLLLSDVVLPGMSGRDAARRLVALRPRMRVVYMSGYTENSIVDHGVLEPGIAFLQKPFAPAALLCKVREILEAGTAPAV